MDYMARNRDIRSENNKIVREVNTLRIIRILQDVESATVDALMKKADLSYPTAFNIVKGLVEEGIVERRGYASSTGGRQAYLYSICADYGYTLGIHIYDTWTSLAITNIRGGVVYQYNDHTPPNLSEIDNIICGRINTALEHACIPASKLIRAGVCTSDKLSEKLLASSLDPAKIVSEHLNVQTELFSDSEVQIFLDRVMFLSSHMADYIHIVFSESIDASVYHGDSKYYKLSPLLKHVTVVPNGALCSCGKKGCLETYFNGAELHNNYCAFCTSEGLDVDQSRINDRHYFKSLLSLSLTGNKAAWLAIKAATEHLAMALSNLMLITGIYHMVISGLYCSNDIKAFGQLQNRMADMLPLSVRGKLDLAMGLALPADCALGVCRLLNSQFVFHLEDSSKK